LELVLLVNCRVAKLGNILLDKMFELRKVSRKKIHFVIKGSNSYLVPVLVT
jgi:hypothetical protein